MRKTVLAFLVVMLSAAPLAAQPPSGELSPYEEQRYGDKLWQVPRDPYQREYRTEEYKARPYIPPEETREPPPAARPRDRGRSSVRTVTPRQLREPTRTQQRFQERKQFENNQRRIEDRSRIQPPGPIILKQSNPGSLNAERQYFLVSALATGKSYENSRRTQFKKLP